MSNELSADPDKILGICQISVLIALLGKSVCSGLLVMSILPCKLKSNQQEF